MKKLGIVITDGVGFRNFILSDFLVEAEKTFDEVVILSCLPSTIYSGFVAKSRIIELDVFEEKFKTWFFRKAKEVAHLKFHKKNNFGIQDSLKINASTSKSNRGYATRFIFKVTSVLHSEKWIQRFNFWQQLSFKNDSKTVGYRDILIKENFDLLFFTHQRPPFIAPLVYQAEKLNVNTASFIFSWDNLASKGRMAANFNYYLVWSDLMKSELQQFYSAVKSKDIEVVGTPQFEPYVLDHYKVSREEFVSKFQLNSNLKTICFSCGDIATSKNDELYIEIIANAIKEGEIKEVNFIIRTSPAEDPIRFSKYVEKFPFIKWNYPKWNLSRENHQESWTQRIPSVEDVKDLRSLLEYSDLNINMLSTMSLDFIQFDKPVINTVFGNSKNGFYDDQRFLNYAHIEKVVNSKATKIVKNKEELVNAINLYLENHKLDSENRKQLLQLQVSKPLQQTGKRIADTLLKWA
ncbi:hypothetical protein Flavo103_16900 [Flavobacterium collinsii]|jgi:hypothetical protein|uniref:hypothetical protein n=1 Tax=Flavobacterium collinsii TaxID=1114861 RepID=UPI0022CA35A8|nr:hypothetical protein [Flavobacterium collinsii]GIQ58554.1 hypothetical protein Flavo103_16900 [Flavobacterium collinsii]